MTPVRTYVSYSADGVRSALSRTSAPTLEALAALFNRRATVVMPTQNVYRNVFGGLFELSVDIRERRVKAFALEGGAWVGDVDVTDRTLDEIVDGVEAIARRYSQGYVTCADCGQAIKRCDVAGAYYGGRHCATCWPKWSEKAKEVE